MRREFKEFKEFIKGKNVAVVGIGVSNKPLIHFLVKLGAKVTAFDKKSKDQLGDTYDELMNIGVNAVLGEGYLDKLTGFQVVFKTPSMRFDNPVLVRAKEEGVYITSEMEEFIKYCPAKIFGVTGSDGKTTTTTLIYNILKEEGYKAWVGGNIGTPLFAEIENINKEDKVVLELSSFQLMKMEYSGNVAVVTNLSPNHLDMHKGMEEYVEAKKNIFKYQGEKDLLILNRDNDITNGMVSEAKGDVRQFSIKEIIEDGGYFKDEILYIKGKPVCKKDEIKILGMHNVENLLAAFCATYEEVSIESMKKVATNFTGVEHRTEFIREIEGIKYYNDSIASSPTRTLAGLKSFHKPVVLIAGGYDKNIPFEPLAEEGYSKIKALVLLGVTKNKIKDAFEKVMEDKKVNIPIYLVNSLEEAVEKAREVAEKGDIITLSPACASFDMFPNFEVRGNKFKEIINSLK
ncbi:UDP-N-acetylmuramoyl-L-alanine--D-glutamate ligase [Haloimpatiens lingqiaonensis]|uniref:UDP-N-acetylmuramoyl-L-alanine--D-glutamate ligase n=1 Tax=Haloimpatiens lingqiaonensis TaxID=1380675 RepID=UPI0010FD9AFA|nr:UDP-N-acetylmuramoyl-L-alanine--D-glutamate ligase [Haloimpatiens lingqiaonensis]